ncbi:thiamine ABC transporter substrate binding subunit [Thorsellia kenyensis]|uniref:Thiamine-binding periplasmic protein n=1 Tax=Thorsellia kenyensis TaxID=1549888 RepID=A0ABV6CB71_9GAMM
MSHFSIRSFQLTKKTVTLVSVGLLFSSFVALSAELNNQNNILTIYTYDSFVSEYGPGPQIKEAFEKECNCTVNFIGAADGVTLLNKIRNEGKNTKADIVLGLDNNLLQEAVDTGLFAPSDVDLTNIDMPFGWSSTLFVPFDYGFFSFVYDKEKTKEVPTSLKELVYSDKPWTIIYQDPRTSTPGLGFILWMQSVFGDNVSDAYKNLEHKTVTVTKGWSEAYSLFLKGEADFVLSYTTSPAYHEVIENKNNFAALNLEEGHYLQIEVAGKIAHTKNNELADSFMQFMVSEAFQSQIPTTNWMYPVINTKTSAIFDNLYFPKDAFEFGAVEVADKKKMWIETWQNALSL